MVDVALAGLGGAAGVGEVLVEVIAEVVAPDQVSAEIAMGGLLLDAGHNYIENPGNAYFAYGSDGALYSTNFTSIIRNTLGAGPSSEAWATSSQFIGNLAEESGTVYATVTDYGTNRSSVFAVVPEPATAVCMLLGAGMLFLRRRR